MRMGLDPRGYYREKRKKENLEMIGTAIVGTILIGGGALVACSNKDIPAEDIVTKTSLRNEINDDIVSNETKIFAKGEHVLSVRVRYDRHNNDELAGYAVNNTPEGYEVFQVTPYIVKVGYGSETDGYDIWFKNTEPVEVEASYNTTLKQYGYYTFGKVIEDEKVLEK